MQRKKIHKFRKFPSFAKDVKSNQFGICVSNKALKQCDMEGERILMAAGVTAAVLGTAAFVFWGPSGLWSSNEHDKN